MAGASISHVAVLEQHNLVKQLEDLWDGLQQRCNHNAFRLICPCAQCFADAKGSGRVQASSESSSTRRALRGSGHGIIGSLTAQLALT